MPQIRCQCKRVLSYRAEQAGKLVKCPGCSAKIRLPEAAPEMPPARAGKPAATSRAPDEQGELQLESPAADIPLAAPAPAWESSAPSEVPLPQVAAGARVAPKPGAADQDYWRSLPGAFRYPLTADGIITLMVGVLVFTVGHYLMFIAAFFPLLGFIFVMGISIIGAGYLTGYLMTIVERTAHGEDEPPDWPDLTDWEETILKPFGFLLGLCIVGVGPSIAYRYLAHPPVEAVALAIFAAGLLYMPMGLLCVALANDYAGLNPIRVIRAIFSVPGRYFVAWLLVACCVAAELQGGAWVSQIPVPFVGTVLQQIVSCYFLFVAMRILGLLYLKSSPQLDWLA
jgi:hypothetical protein